MVSSNGSRTWQHAGEGLVHEVFTEKHLDRLKGQTALGYIQDSADNRVPMGDIQPFTASHKGNVISIAHSGNFNNTKQLKSELEAKGAIFLSSMDSEIISHFVATCGISDLDAALKYAFKKIRGAFSLIMMVNDTLVAVRDAHGFRPLSLGRLPSGGYAVASETCALDAMAAENLRDIEPGEVVIINQQGLNSTRLDLNPHKQFCLLEQVAFVRADSNGFGFSVYESRKLMGTELFHECQPDADFVISTPNSDTCAALGYSQASGIPFEMGFVRDYYTNGLRDSFSERSEKKPKFNPVRSLINGKRVIVIDDSVIGGTDFSDMIFSLRKAGAKEVHLLVGCPPIRYQCDYGIHFQIGGEKLPHNKLIEQVQNSIGADTLYCLSTGGLLAAAGQGSASFCKACIDGSKMPLI